MRFIRHTPWYGLLSVATALACGLILVGTFFVRAQASDRRAVQQCEWANENRAVLRDVLILARDFPRPESLPPLTDEQRAASRDFYAQALDRTGPIDCEEAE